MNYPSELRVAARLRSKLQDNENEEASHLRRVEEEGLQYQRELASRNTGKMRALLVHILEKDGESFGYLEIPGDGACLPRALSTGCMDKGLDAGTGEDMRAAVVQSALKDPMVEMQGGTVSLRFSSLLGAGVDIPQWCAQYSNAAEYCGLDFITLFDAR